MLVELVEIHQNEQLASDSVDRADHATAQAAANLVIRIVINRIGQSEEEFKSEFESS